MLEGVILNNEFFYESRVSPKSMVVIFILTFFSLFVYLLYEINARVKLAETSREEKENVEI